MLEDVQTAGYASSAALIFLGIHPTTLYAQSRIAGVVKDTTGAVLPGVTVEASSPALIEKARTVVTDGQGIYEIVDLRPGVYAITFTLSGFSTVRHDDIDLPASFTATVNAEMKVGEVSETLTVTGQAPLWTCARQRGQQTVGQTEMLTLAGAESRSLRRTSRRFPGSPASIWAVSASRRKGRQFTGATGGNYTAIDGFSTQESAAVGGGGTTTTSPRRISRRWRSPRMRVMPRTGWAACLERDSQGRRQSVQRLFLHRRTTSGMVANNVELGAAGEGVSQAGLKEGWDVTPAFGGPIVKDKLWFYNSWRSSGIGAVHPEPVRQHHAAGLGVHARSVASGLGSSRRTAAAAIRLTWQASPRNKFSAFTDWQPHTYYNRNYGSLTSLEATTYSPAEPNQFTTAGWKSPVSNRLLLEAGASYYDTIYYAAARPVRHAWRSARHDAAAGFRHGGETGVVERHQFRIAEPGRGYRMGHQQISAGEYQGLGVVRHRDRMRSRSASRICGATRTSTRTPTDRTRSRCSTASPNSLQEWEQPNGRTSNIRADLGIFARTTGR